MEKSTSKVKPESVPYIVYEGEMARQERHIKRLWVALMVAIVSCVIIVGVFIWYINQYDFTSYEQDGQGVNIIGNMNGVDYDGPASSDANQEEPFDSEG